MSSSPSEPRIPRGCGFGILVLLVIVVLAVAATFAVR